LFDRPEVDQNVNFISSNKKKGLLEPQNLFSQYFKRAPRHSAERQAA